MLKLLKYDWKRNATMSLAGLIILLVAQIVNLTVGWRNGWNEQFVIVIACLLFFFSGFLVFLMACQTFGANLKAYSRRLLPLPTIYTIASPLVLMFGLSLVLFLVFAAFDAVFAAMYDKEASFLSLLAEQLTFGEAALAIALAIWGSLFTSLVIFFSMAFSRIVEGKGGTFLGIIVCILIFVTVPWVEDILFSPEQIYGLIRLSPLESGNGSMTLTFGSANSLEWLTLAFEAGVLICLIYGTIFLIERRIKL
ncbi:hypothetical protein D3P09_04455 [Paenibacillus pinisoli]|uniref:Uncharacterized protein n=1 Tax=Paenibacillus pinisoli TaxID=1276110 RepID=A0A3A6Q181_9BACL|nr:hypothetical protein [Paenibacillus pinisoli]RJX41243.1 hypothetical protein D3P09_04455 [Paenibacillus pinisoli]